MKIKYILILFILIHSFYLDATNLSFVPGHKASYHIVQTVKMEAETAKQPSALQSTSEIMLELCLLNPNEVELVIRKLIFNVSAKGLEYKKSNYSYNSTDPSIRCPIEADLSQLINVPLHFRIERDAVMETTGYLKQVLNIPSDITEAGIRECIPCGSERDFQFLLSVIFHLSDKKIDSGKPLDVTIAPFFEIPDEPWAEGLKFILKKEKNQYQVSLPLSGNTIKAKWQGDLDGTMQISQWGLSGKLDGQIHLSGSVTWNVNNALLQERNINFTQQYSGKIGSYSSKSKTTIQQVWKSKPLN